MSDIEKIGPPDHESTTSREQIIDPDAGLSPEEKKAAERKLLWKLDIQLIPWLTFLYLVSFLDRTNIGNAKIAHITKDLHISNHKFNIALTIFYVSYALFEPLANALLKRLRPSIFIPLIMVSWGLCMLSMGFIKNWSGLMAARFFLGLCESGLFPGINYYLSCWYKREEFGVRAAIFFSGAALAGSFGGILAAAISKMDGVANRPGWSWIFILEGLITIVVGIISFFLIQDFPDKATFLSPEDRARVIIRLRADMQASAEHESFKTSYLWDVLKDWKTYAGMLIYMGPLMPLYAFSVFLPSIIQAMSFTTPTAVFKNQLLSVPPYAAAAILTVVVGFLSDRTKKRAVFNMGLALLGTVGFVMLIATTNPYVQYAGTFLGAMGIYPSISLTIAWVANNVEGVYKRGIALGFVIGWGNLNGVVSSNIYIGAPRYYAGHGAVIGYMMICLFGGSVLMATLLGIENKKRREGKRDHWVEGKSEAEIRELGDKRPDFIYVI